MQACAAAPAARRLSNGMRGMAKNTPLPCMQTGGCIQCVLFAELASLSTASQTKQGVLAVYASQDSILPSFGRDTGLVRKKRSAFRSCAQHHRRDMLAVAISRDFTSAFGSSSSTSLCNHCLPLAQSEAWGLTRMHRQSCGDRTAFFARLWQGRIGPVHKAVLSEVPL